MIRFHTHTQSRERKEGKKKCETDRVLTVSVCHKSS